MPMNQGVFIERCSEPRCGSRVVTAANHIVAFWHSHTNASTTTINITNSRIEENNRIYDGRKKTCIYHPGSAGIKGWLTHQVWDVYLIWYSISDLSYISWPTDRLKPAIPRLHLYELKQISLLAAASPTAVTVNAYRRRTSEILVRDTC